MRLLRAFHTCKVQIDQRIVENVDAYNFNSAQNCTWSNILCDMHFNTIHLGCFEINCLYVAGLLL